MPSSDKIERQFFSGNTLEQAVMAAARHYDLDPDRVAYKLRDKKHGFLNIRRRVVIEVDPAAPEQPEQRRPDRGAAAPNSAEEQISDAQEGPKVAIDEQRYGSRDQSGHGRQDRTNWRGEENSWVGGDQTDREVAAFEKAIEELSALVGTVLRPSIRREEEGFEIELLGPASKSLREDRGSGLGAVEHLLPRLVRSLSGRGVPCRVDSEGFRAAHEEELSGLARQAAEDVRRDSEERRLEPMNPADRRLIHLALADDPTVRTESEGDGFLKRVRIVPS